ncbi:MAG: YraN family protein [Clostridiales bacterium]|nr:YraN family protein [Clostridiales bacterium]
MDLGQFGEDKATEYLISNGYKVLCRNFRWKGGEIDIVAKDKERRDLIVFFEVKTRRDRGFGLPCEAVTASKLRKIKNTIKVYASLKQCIGKDFRIDVIELLLLGEKMYVRHIKNIT